jgi:hypothetical protein
MARPPIKVIATTRVLAGPPNKRIDINIYGDTPAADLKVVLPPA